MTRRSLACGLIASGLVGSGAAAQDMAADPRLAWTPEQGPASEFRLLANTLTRMSAPVSLNTRRGYSLVLDTGAGRTTLSQDIAEDLGLPPGPLVRVHGVTAAETAPTVVIDRLGFGDRRFHGVVAPVFPRTDLSADGLLGLDVLSHFRIKIDTRRMTMELTPSGVDAIDVGRAFGTPTRLARSQDDSGRRNRTFGQLILDNTHADGLRVQTFVDSGAQYSIGNPAFLNALSPSSRLSVDPIAVTIYGVTGQTVVARPALVRSLDIGGGRLGPTPLLFADLHAFHALELNDRPTLLIGADLIYRFRSVVLDYGRSRMRFIGVRRGRAMSFS